MKIIFLLSLYSFVISLLLTPLLAVMCRRLQLVDLPDNARKLHTTPVPRVGGIPIGIAYFSSLGILYLIWGEDLPIPRGNILLFLNLLPAAGLVFLTGLLDDLFGLKPWQKLLGQLAAAAWAYYVGVRIMGTDGLPHWVSLPLSLLWLIGCTNAFNLIDGLDGLAAGIGLLATLTIVVAAVINHNLVLAICTVPLAGSLLGFLIYNFNPASIFMGDCGSLFLGFLLGCFGVIWSHKAVTLLGLTAPLMALAIPVLDVGLSIIRRFLRRQPLFAADRGHIHHRLLAMGLKPRAVAIVLYGAGGLAAAVSLLQSMANSRYSGFVVVLFCTITWLGVQRLRYVELNILRRMVLGGEFRRILTSRIRMQLFEDSLAAAKTADECWLLIRDTCHELGFCEVIFKYGGVSYRDRFSEFEAFKGWNAHVKLSESEYVDILTTYPSGQNGAIGPLMEVLRSQMRSKERAPTAVADIVDVQDEGRQISSAAGGR